MIKARSKNTLYDIWWYNDGDISNSGGSMGGYNRNDTIRVLNELSKAHPNDIYYAVLSTDKLRDAEEVDKMLKRYTFVCPTCGRTIKASSMFFFEGYKKVMQNAPRLKDKIDQPPRCFDCVKQELLAKENKYGNF